jgi:hypothetical protein
VAAHAAEHLAAVGAAAEFFAAMLTALSCPSCSGWLQVPAGMNSVAVAGRDDDVAHTGDSTTQQPHKCSAEVKPHLLPNRRLSLLMGIPLAVIQESAPPGCLLLHMSDNTVTVRARHAARLTSVVLSQGVQYLCRCQMGRVYERVAARIHTAPRAQSVDVASGMQLYVFLEIKPNESLQPYIYQFAATTWTKNMCYCLNIHE